ncbi:MAG: hypothetical protein ACI3ZL_01550, partial [Candidatus Cryptobacteroides sp.]
STWNFFREIHHPKCPGDLKMRVISHPKDFCANCLDYETYALVYSKSIADINGEQLKQTDDRDKLNGYVRISAGRKKIYRKCRAYCGIKGDEISLGYRSRAELGGNNNVTVAPTGWFSYHWMNSEPGLKHSFRITVVALALTALSSLLSIISLFIEFPIC